MFGQPLEQGGMSPSSASYASGQKRWCILPGSLLPVPRRCAGRTWIADFFNPVLGGEGGGQCRIASLYPSQPARGRPATSTRSSSARASPGCTCSTACAASGSRRGSSRRAAASAAPGTGTAIPGARCDVESMDYSYSFSDELQQEWQLDRAVRHPARDPALHRARRRSVRPPPRHPARHAGDRGTLRRGDEPLGDRDGPRRPRVGAILHHGHRLPVDRAGARRSRASRPSRADWYHTGHWPHEGVDFTGQRVGVIGTGSSAHPVHPDHRPAGRLPGRVPADTELQRARAQRPAGPGHERRVKANYAELRRQARQSRVGFVVPTNDHSALDVSAGRAAPRVRGRAGNRGGLGFAAAFSDLLTAQEANDTAAEFFRAKIRADGPRPRASPRPCRRRTIPSAPSASASTPATTTRSTATTSPWSISAATPIEAITPRGVRTRDAEYELDSIVFATGFDAMTGALLEHRHPRPGRRTLRAEVGRGPRTYLGLAIAGFPNLFTITGPGSPSVISNMMVSIEQHVDWIADCLAHLRAQGLGASRRRPRRRRRGWPMSTTWGQHHVVGAGPRGVASRTPFADEAQVEVGFQVAIEVVPGIELIKRGGNRRGELTGLRGTEHDGLWGQVRTWNGRATYRLLRRCMPPFSTRRGVIGID